MELLQILIDGTMAGLMYSLVALGFALIYKASRVFNFAQGIMVVFAVLALINFSKGYDVNLWWLAALVLFVVGAVLLTAKRRTSRKKKIGGASLTTGILLGLIAAIFGLQAVFVLKMSVWLAIPATLVMMVLLAIAIERFVLRPLVGQGELILFMATIGLFFFLEGFGETIWGGINQSVPAAKLGISTGPWHLFGGYLKGGLTIQKTDMTAAAISGLMVVALAVMFRKTQTGRALRAVADDHQAALSVGIPLNTMWIVVWSVAGVVALIAGIFWGISGGSASFALVLIAFKALPVLILGGFTSVPGVIVGGFIIGVGEKLAELYWGDFLGGSIEEWFAYVLALVILLFRPQGLFGEKIIERV
ncbi:MAG: branched-chain amino acid ABC transporter permease [Alphaproteobacteria bacterium]|nr:branched-chain amino acid ABC transporter permease [Alphaproteobacteria bacterium]